MVGGVFPAACCNTAKVGLQLVQHLLGIEIPWNSEFFACGFCAVFSEVANANELNVVKSRVDTGVKVSYVAKAYNANPKHKIISFPVVY